MADMCDGFPDFQDIDWDDEVSDEMERDQRSAELEERRVFLMAGFDELLRACPKERALVHRVRSMFEDYVLLVEEDRQS